MIRRKRPGFSRCMAIPSRHSDQFRIVAGERTFFVTSSTWGKRNLLQSTRTAELFIQVLFAYREQGKYRIHEFVVMPDHFHVLITVGRDMSIERAVQLIKGGFAFRATRQLGFTAPVWQKGFSEVRVLEQEAFAGQAEYIRDNPVAAHLIDRAEDYLYSSAGAQFQLDPPPQRLKPRLSHTLIGTPEGVP